MSRKTQKQLQSFTHTVKQGMNMLQGKDVPNYTLIFLDGADNYTKGSENTFWKPYLSLGRGSGNDVKYGDDFSTVSRRHAGILVDEGRIYVEHDSNASNPTLVNGQAVNFRQLLNTGDEIQLSYEGPKIRFITTPKNKTTASMGFTRRFAEFGNQALRPYKRAIALLSFLLIGLLGYTTYYTLKTDDHIETLESKNFETQQELDQAIVDAEKQKLEDEKRYRELDNKNSEEAKKLRGKISNQQSKIKELESRPPVQVVTSKGKSSNTGATVIPGGTTNSGGSNSGGSTSGGSSLKNIDPQEASRELSKFKDQIYFIYITSVEVFHPELNIRGPVDLAENLKVQWSGTGFMTEGGEFITARHVIYPWRFDTTCGGEKPEINGGNEGVFATALLNSAPLAGGHVEVKYLAISPNGDSFTFTDKEVNMTESMDKTICKGDEYLTQKQFTELKSDWASIRIASRAGSSNLQLDRKLSRNMETATPLFGYGYSRGLSLQQLNKGFDPLFITGRVVQAGTVNGTINITNNAISGGSSGGPLLTKTASGWKVVGIISHGTSDVVSLVPIDEVN